MSNETNHSGSHDANGSKQVAVSFSSAFWIIIILVGVFICALNFVKVMSSEKEEGKSENKTEMATPAGEKK